MSLNPYPRQRPKPRPRSRPRLLWPTPLPFPPTPTQAQWSPESVILEELLRVNSLPQLVQCRSHVLRSQDDRPFPVPLDRPILLAEKRTARHLLARIVVFDEKNRTFCESTDTVVIPEDYEGNFLRLHCRTTKDKSHVQSLETIAHADTPAFLNLSDMTSFPAGPRDPTDQSKLIYTVGNVFLVDEPLPSDTSREQRSRLNSASSGSSRHKSETTSGSESSGSESSRGNGLMRCLDERGVAVVVPTSQAGEMVAVQKNADQRPKLSVKSSEMIAGEQFPILARYAYGKKPPRLTAFSKLLTLLDTFEETSVIACVIDGPSLMLMELPMTSSLQFQAALNNYELLSRTPHLRSALHVCRTRGHDLARDIKFKLKFTHRMQETSRRTLVTKENEGGLPRTTTRARLVDTESYLYI